MRTLRGPFSAGLGPAKHFKITDGTRFQPIAWVSREVGTEEPVILAVEALLTARLTLIVSAESGKRR